MDVQLGDYRLLHKLGEGGAANVYLAVRAGPAGFRKLCVVKCLKGALAAEPEMRSAFLAEATLSARLSHPNIVQVHEVFEAKGIPTLVMDYLEGRALSTLRREVELPLPLQVYVLSEALRGLDHFHQLTDEAGRPLAPVHRDVSPHNLFVTYEGEVKVLDFGIAKLAGDEQTREGVVKGKLAYMAPEQLMASVTDVVDRTTDLFAMGIVLWEAVAGRSMCAGLREVEIIRQRLAGEVPSLRAVVDDAPPSLVAVVERALHVDRAERYATADDMRQGLRSYLEEVSTVHGREGLKALLEARYGEERSTFRQYVAELAARTGEPAPAVAELSLPPAAIRPGNEDTTLRPTALADTPSGLRVGAATVTRRKPRVSSGLVLAGVAALAVLGSLALQGLRRAPEGAPSSAAAGSARGSAPSLPHPVAVAPATCARSPLLFDFEAGRAESCATFGRQGGPFFAFFDGTGTTTPPPGLLRTADQLPTARGASRWALHWHADELTDWGGGVGVSLNSQKPVDLSRFEGVALWVKASPATALRIGLAMPETLDTAYGGDCEARGRRRCGDHFSARRVVSTLWTELHLPFRELRQEGWGESATWDPRRVLELHVAAFLRDAARPEQKALTVEVWLDDAELY